MGPAMARCVFEAESPLVAFIEDHCYASPGWAAAVLYAFDRSDVEIVSYAFRDTEPTNWLKRSFLVTEYGRWMDPALDGPVDISTLNNVAYRKASLVKHGDDLRTSMEIAHVVHRRIQRSGGVAWLASNALVAHEDWTDFWAGCRANGVLKRLYGGRLADDGWGWPRRTLYAIGMSVAPALHLWRLAWSVRNRPALWGTFLAALPVAVPVFVYSSLQESLGYVFGSGSASEAFTEMEVGSLRQR